jgi:hypothetical protein|tara:strand:- start:7026 stop:7562 length:537 start_codon:yes stop_codon:yes gene_type:complete
MTARSNSLRTSLSNIGKGIKEFVSPITDAVTAGGKFVKDVITLGGEIPLEVSAQILSIDQLKEKFPDASEDMLNQLYLNQAVSSLNKQEDKGFVSRSTIGELSPDPVDARMVALTSDTSVSSVSKPTEAILESLTSKVLNSNESIADGIAKRNEFFQYQDAISIDPEIDTTPTITLGR